jgi:hypothetical protein
MQKKNSLGEAAPILIAGFFLVAPIALLMRIAWADNAPTAEELTQDYIRAVQTSLWPAPSEVSHSLLEVDPNKPVTVVAFMRREKVANYEGKSETPKDKDQTWVTVAPMLKTFCQQYVKEHGSDPDQLKLRLKQRLGLPPQPDYDTFVELKLDPKDVSKFFRPCGDPATNTNSCEPPAPPQPEEIREKLKKLNVADDKEFQPYWVLSNYYRSFASQYQFPWTALGYTFDWAPRENGSGDFVRRGESEFVIAPGTPIQFLSSADAVAYCTP